MPTLVLAPGVGQPGREPDGRPFPWLVVGVDGNGPPGVLTGAATREAAESLRERAQRVAAVSGPAGRRYELRRGR